MSGLPAVVLLSGGMDSAVVLAIARSEGMACHAMSFDYGQRHRQELTAARNIARTLGATRHFVTSVNLEQFGGSALTDASMAVPTASQAGRESIPATYVPARNTVFLSLALAYSEVIGARQIFIGANAVDYSGYPDCRPTYIALFESVANLGTKAGALAAERGEVWYKVRAPIIELSKSQIVREGVRLGVDFALTHSCYDPDEVGAACGKCEACTLRRKGFDEAGVPDPTVYTITG